MKTIYIFIFFYALNIQAIDIAELKKVYSNDMQEFSIGMNSFTCKPYGVVTLEQALANKDLMPACKQRIENYLSANPLKKYFIQMGLHVRQNYHIEFKNTKCAVYAYGEKTLSEALLEQGLAIKEANFNDDEFRYLFVKAQNRAKNSHAGVWSDADLQSCILGAYQ
ncbi:hypothetical protein KKA17_04495 [bacterium]|nr:hypothetical protein [bacterium]MBU1883444.1 hypothetical protein [bacterium]